MVVVVIKVNCCRWVVLSTQGEVKQHVSSFLCAAVSSVNSRSQQPVLEMLLELAAVQQHVISPPLPAFEFQLAARIHSVRCIVTQLAG